MGIGHPGTRRWARSRRQVFEDNRKAWSGDHSVDPVLVPGVLFCNRKMDATDPGIEDLAPTALKLFGVDPPGVDGRQASIRTGMKKRAIITIAVITLLLAGLAGCSRSDASANGAAAKRIIVLGIDGMDPGFLERHWVSLPNLNRLRQEGELKRLETTMPPQSPVAWSTFITGMDPGGHGHLRFRSPQSTDAGAIFFHGADGRRYGPHAFTGAVCAAAFLRPRGVVPKRHALLAGSLRAPCACQHHSHADQFSAHSVRGRLFGGRHGHARPARHIRYVHLLHRRGIAEDPAGARRPDRACESERLSRRTCRFQAPPTVSARTNPQPMWT